MPFAQPIAPDAPGADNYDERTASMCESSAPSAFDSATPWGLQRPSFWARASLGAAHAVPAIPGGRRLAKWLSSPVKRACDRPLDVQIWGYRLRLAPHGNSTESKWLRLARHCETKERLFLRKNLRPGAVFLDVGANVGLYSLWAAKFVGTDGRVVAIEPDPEMQRRLRFNLQTNQLRRIELMPVALSDDSGDGLLNIGTTNRGQNTMLPVASSRGYHREAVAVKTLTVAALCDQLEIRKIDGMKIDVEGYEDRILQPFVNHSPRSLLPAFMIIEHAHRSDWNVDAIDLLQEAGYRVIQQTRGNSIMRLTHDSLR